MLRKKPPILDRILARLTWHKKVDHWSGSGNWSDEIEDIQVVHDLDEANLISSTIKFSDRHLPLIDLDMNAALVPSTTPGHFHLYIDRPMTFDNYIKLLNVMVDVGLVQPGFLKRTEMRGYGSLRKPGVMKGQEV